MFGNCLFVSKVKVCCNLQPGPEQAIQRPRQDP